MRPQKALWLIVIAILFLTPPTFAQDAGHPGTEVIAGLYPGKAYSPYAQRSFPSRVFWGETQERAYTSPIWYTP